MPSEPKRIVVLPSGMIVFYYQDGTSERWKPGQPGYAEAKEKSRG